MSTPKAWRTASGAKISESEAGQLAEEFEKNNDALDGLELTFPRQAGRPSLTQSRGVSPQVSFRIPLALRERAEQLANKRGTTVSALAREALEDLLRHTG